MARKKVQPVVAGTISHRELGTVALQRLGHRLASMLDCHMQRGLARLHAVCCAEGCGARRVAACVL